MRTYRKEQYFLIFFITSFLFLSSCVNEDCLTNEDSTSLDENSRCPSSEDQGGEVEEEIEEEVGEGNDEVEEGEVEEVETPETSDDISENNEGEVLEEETLEESFSSPWRKDNTVIVIDAYQGNSIDWDEMAGDSKVVGVIHRASIGTRVDKKYESRREIARERGYLWGAYHLGYSGDIEEQVDVFLDLVGDDEETLMVLDLEDVSNRTFMNLNEAKEFMEMVYERTGRIPIVYANHSTTKSLNRSVASHPLFQKSKLWYARFKSNVSDYPAGIWPNYFLWQFSSEINCRSTGSCLYNVPGTKYDMDINVYYGSAEKLRESWGRN